MSAFEASRELEELLSGLTRAEKQRYLRIAEQVSKWPEQTPDGVVTVMRDIVDAQSDRAVRQMIEDIEQLDDPVQEEMWRLVHQFGLIDARRNASIIEARLATIDALQRAVTAGAREVPNLHVLVRRDPWLLDPRWHLLDDELDVATFGIEFEPEEDEEGQRLDFLFVLAPEPPAVIEEVIVVEIKRGYYPDGRVRKVTEAEIDKFVGYVAAVEEHYSKETRAPSIQGLMVAQDYAQRAARKRKQYEQIITPRYEFKTWGSVISETQRMHTGWLHISRRRSSDASNDSIF